MVQPQLSWTSQSLTPRHLSWQTSFLFPKEKCVGHMEPAWVVVSLIFFSPFLCPWPQAQLLSHQSSSSSTRGPCLSLQCPAPMPFDKFLTLQPAGACESLNITRTLAWGDLLIASQCPPFKSKFIPIISKPFTLWPLLTSASFLPPGRLHQPGMLLPLPYAAVYLLNL